MGFILRHIKLIIWAIIGVIVISIVVFMTTSIDSELERITDAYLSLTGNTNVEGKKDNFYSAYIEQQEENQEAIANGDSAAGTTTIVGSATSGGAHSYTGSGTAYGYATEAEANAAISAKAAEIGISTDSFRVENVNNRYYVVEWQSSTWWNQVMNTDDQTLAWGGCMWFTSAAALSVKTGEIYTVSDLLTAVGYTVTVKSNKYYLWDSSGNNAKLPCIGRMSGEVYADGTTAATPVGLVTTGSNGTVSISTVSSIDRTALSNGSIFIVHINGDASTHYLSSGTSGEHWFIVIGYDNSSNVYYIVNASGAAASTHSYNADTVDHMANGGIYQIS